MMVRSAAFRAVGLSSILILSTLSLAACAGGSNARSDAEVQDGEQNADGAYSSSDASFDGPALDAFSAPGGSPKITFFGWGKDGDLHIGYADGKWARLDANAQDGALSAVTKNPHAVVALSPNTQLALVASTPPTIIRLHDHQILLRLNKVDALRTGGFFPSGDGFFAGDESGTLHVWNNSEESLNQVTTRDLKQVIQRNAPAFSAQIAPLSGDVSMTRTDDLLMAIPDGTLLRWNFKSPETIDSLVRLPAAGQSLAASRDYLAATTNEGALRVVDRARSAFVPWSLEEKGDAVAANESLAESFVVVETGADQLALSMRAFEDGAFRWRVPAPAGELCGLAISQDARTIALCVDGGVIFVNAQNGAATAAARRADDSVQWR